MLAVAYWDLETDRVLLHHEFEKPVKEGEGRVKTRAALHRAEGENILLERLSVNGKPVELQDSQEKGPRSTAGGSAAAVDPAATSTLEAITVRASSGAACW